MKEYLDVLKKSRLFEGLSEEEIPAILACQKAVVKDFSKNQTIFRDGDVVDSVGIIMSGELQTIKTDYYGNANIISRLFASDIIAASVCYSTGSRVPFDIVCAAPSAVLVLNSMHIIRPCQSACNFHSRMIQNMLGIIADRNILLAAKIDILTHRTIREKVLAYLNSQSRRAGGGFFSVPLSRRQMAEYLSINRSALSRQLSALQDEGVLEFSGNRFRLN